MSAIKFEFLKDKLYLLIPMLCVVLWAFLYLIMQDFKIHQGEFKGDFYVLYNAGKVLLNNPSDLYNPENRYYYLPVFAMIVSITFSLLPFFIADNAFYIMNIIFGILFTYEFNRILILMDLIEKKLRFLFLIIISNGFHVYHLFYFNQFKYIIGFLLFFIIRRELQYRKEEREKNLKFYLLNLFLFALVIAIFPFFIFLLLIYIFNDIHIADIFKMANIRIYLIVISIFLIQNFLFIVFPSFILKSFELFTLHSQNELGSFSIFYLSSFEWYNISDYLIINLISSLIIGFITILLIFNKNLKVEFKFSYFSLACIIFSTYASRALLILFPFTLLLYIPFLYQNEKGINFIKHNIIILIALISVLSINMAPPSITILKYFSELEGSIFFLLYQCLKLICVSVLVISILILKLKIRDKK
ncbi:MAG: hypothetical protein ACFFAH_00815 [Promethearchaeota archaeon]